MIEYILMKNKTASPFRNIPTDSMILLLSSSFLLLTALQFLLIQSKIQDADRFAWQFYTLLGISLVISLFNFLNTSMRTVGLFIKLCLLFLMTYPLGSYIWIGFSLFLSLVLEIVMYIEYPRSSWFMIISLIFSMMLQKPRNAFHSELQGPAIHDLISFVSYSLFSIIILSLYAKNKKILKEEKQLTGRLDDAMSSMAKANLGFQSYTNSLELETLKKERKRVSREIHDTVGYSLTNIRIMLDAASLMIEKNPEESGNLIGKSMLEASFCLEETRAAMRLLRSKELARPKGLRAFFQLVSVFADATGIQVQTEFGNSPDSFGIPIDKAVFRFIQEGLTNSFRHGRATEIHIYFWIQDQVLKVSMQDNGRGTAVMDEGIGITGMKERLDELNGKLDYYNITGGFEVTISIPLHDKNRLTEDKM